jgi:hypothetical protein
LSGFSISTVASKLDLLAALVLVEGCTSVIVGNWDKRMRIILREKLESKILTKFYSIRIDILSWSERSERWRSYRHNMTTRRIKVESRSMLWRINAFRFYISPLLFLSYIHTNDRII